MGCRNRRWWLLLQSTTAALQDLVLHVVGKIHRSFGGGGEPCEVLVVEFEAYGAAITPC